MVGSEHVHFTILAKAHTKAYNMIAGEPTPSPVRFGGRTPAPRPAAGPPPVPLRKECAGRSFIKNGRGRAAVMIRSLGPVDQGTQS